MLGVDEGLCLVEQQSGVDAVVVDASGRLHYSRGLLAAGGPGSPLRLPRRRRS